MRVASIIDYPRDKLNKHIWNISEDTLDLQPKIREEIEDIVYSFLDDMDLTEDALLDVFIYGSILTKQYNKNTDIDARILLDGGIVAENYPGMDGDALYELAKDKIHGIKVGDTDHEFNATIVIDGEDTLLGNSPLGLTKKDPVFSLLDKKFMNLDDQIDPNFDPDEAFSAERDAVSDIMTRLDKLVQEAKTETIDIQLIEDALEDGYNPKKLEKKIDEKLAELEKVSEDMVKEFDEVQKNREEGYKTAPKDDRHNNPGNVEYKMLEKYKYIDMLKKVKSILKDGIQEDEVEDMAKALKVTSADLLFDMSDFVQNAPAAPNTLVEPAPTTVNPQGQEEGGMMHGASCPQCGTQVKKGSDSEEELTCPTCGKVFKTGFTINTAPNTSIDDAPYASDVKIYAQEVSVAIDKLEQAMKDLGVSDVVTKQLYNKLNKEKSPTLEPPKDTQDPAEAKAPGTDSKDIGNATKNTTKQLLSRREFMKPHRSWFDEPAQKEPGGSPYTSAPSLAEATKEDKKDKKKKKKPGDETTQPEIMEVIMLLDGIDDTMLQDNDLLEELMHLFPVLGTTHAAVRKVISQSRDHDPAGQYSPPTQNVDYNESPERVIVKDLEEVEHIGEKIGIDWNSVEFTPADLRDGMIVELEHGTKDPETNVTDDDLEETAKIALVHLKEFADYYVRLKAIESEDFNPEDSDMKKQGAAYMTLCPKCKSIQKVNYDQPTECSICRSQIPPYKDTHEEEEKKEPYKDPNWMENKASEKLPSEIGHKVNEDLIKAGLDGNGRFKSTGQALNAISEVLDKYGLQMGSLPGADYRVQTAPEGNITIDLEKSTEDPFSPSQIDNVIISFSWYKHRDDAYEALAYVTV